MKILVLINKKCTFLIILFLIKISCNREFVFLIITRPLFCKLYESIINKIFTRSDTTYIGLGLGSLFNGVPPWFTTELKDLCLLTAKSKIGYLCIRPFRFSLSTDFPQTLLFFDKKKSRSLTG